MSSERKASVKAIDAERRWCKMKNFMCVMFAVMTLALLAASQKFFYCKYCGRKATSVQSLTSSSCLRHPNGPSKGRHALYEGAEKTSYQCKFCGKKSTDIQSLTASKCLRHPNGVAKGNHEPAL